MDGVTDASFRYITAKHGGPDVTLTEFVNIQSALYSPHTLLQDFTYSEIERPVVAQIYGKTPELFYKVAHIVCELGFDGLDINMGCPAKKVAASGCGAALIRTPDLARRNYSRGEAGIQDWHGGQTSRGTWTSTTRRSSRSTAQTTSATAGTRPLERRLIPVSVKTRLGYDRIVIEDWLATLLAEKPAAISLHGRTLAQGYKGEADWHAIARAVEVATGSGTLILGNGDVRDLRDVSRARSPNPRRWRVDRQERAGRSVDVSRKGASQASASVRRRTLCSMLLQSTWRNDSDVVVEHSEHFEQLCRPVSIRGHAQTLDLVLP